MRMKIMEKKSPNIAFRHTGWAFADMFFEAVQRLDVDESELARLAIEKGLEEASHELAERRRAEEAAIAKLREGFKTNPLSDAPFGLMTVTA